MLPTACTQLCKLSVQLYAMQAAWDACQSATAASTMQVPDVLAPVAGALTPLVESILRTDMQRFASFAVSREGSAVH